MNDNNEKLREALERASLKALTGRDYGNRPSDIFWTEPRASLPAGLREDGRLHDLDTQYDDPLKVRALLIELDAWDLENDCFVPEKLFGTETTSTP